MRLLKEFMKAYKSKETLQREKLHKNLKKRASKEQSFFFLFFSLKENYFNLVVKYVICS